MASTDPLTGGRQSVPSFHSILFDRAADRAPGDLSEPEFFRDLNLDQVVQAIVARRDEYELAQLFYEPLRDAEAVGYRHRAFQDLEQDSVAASVRRFAKGMRKTRQRLALASKLYYPRHRERWFMAAAEVYGAAVEALRCELAGLSLTSPGLLAFQTYLGAYVESDQFVRLTADTVELRERLAEVTYAIHLKGLRVTVGAYDDEPDLSEQVEQTFAKFRQGAVKDYRARFPGPPGMTHVQARILELVARLHPEVFGALHDYCERWREFVDDTVARFDREVQFYLAYLEYIAPLKSAGLAFCYPAVSSQDKTIHATAAVDIALASKLVGEDRAVVSNDFRLARRERILVVSGPNQGGKTTFARMFGQLHYLARLGLPVPASDARLFLPDRLFAHFEREEDLATLRGKFEDELVRIHEILEHATGDSILIMNESFTSTTLRDAVMVGTRVLEQIIERDMLCVCVTFVDELASLSETTVSMMSTVVRDDPASRTYKIVRKPADGLAYAVAIAEKHGLTYERLRRRLTA